MTLERRLRAAGLVAPTYAPGGLGSVLPACAHALGAPLTTSTGLASPDAAAALGLPRAARVCVVLVDGLGARLLESRSGHAPFLRSLLGDRRVAYCGFPSTTAASMGLFGTGTAPGRTAMLGYTIRPAGASGLANMVSWEGMPTPEDVQRELTVFEHLAARDVAVTSVGPARFAGSGMTRAALRGSRYVVAESLDARVDAVVATLRKPGLAYLYWGEVDKAGHHHGWQSAEWGAALEDIDGALRRLVRSLPRGTTVVITADHGMVDVDPAQRWDVATEPALAEGIELVAGEPRAIHLYVSPGTDPAAVVQRWSDRLGRAVVPVTREEAEAAGWFGDVADHVRAAIGDVVVATTGRATVVDSATQTSASLGLVGVHGSLTPDEVEIPVLTAVV